MLYYLWTDVKCGDGMQCISREHCGRGDVAGVMVDDAQFKLPRTHLMTQEKIGNRIGQG